jgi:phthalate 4,5-dioxygenase oxygenase subunit
MLSAEENELLCPVEDDAPMRRIMRWRWLPACLSEEVEDRDGAPVHVREPCSFAGVVRKTEDWRTLGVIPRQPAASTTSQATE